LLHLGLGGGTDLDDGDAAHELGQALLELLAVVVAGGVLDLAADLGLTTLDLLLAARAVDDRGVVLVDLDALGLAEVTDGDVLELEAELLGDDLTTGEDGDVLEHLLAAIAEAGGLHGGAVQGATELVHHEGGERLALDVLGDDEQGLLLTGDRLEHRQKILHVGDLLLAQEDVGVLEGGLHALGIRHEVGAQVAAVELHALDDVEGRLGALRLFDGDDAFLADLLHRLAEELADGLVAVGAHGTDLRDLVGITGGLGELLQLLGQRLDGLVDAALDLHGVVAGRDQLGTLTEDRLRQHGGGGGAVASDVAGLGGHLARHLGANVLEAVLELDLLGDGHAVLGDRRRAEALLDDDVAALGAQGDLHRVRESVDAGEDQIPGGLFKDDFLGCHGSVLLLRTYFSMTPRMSSSRRMRCSSPSSLPSVPAYLPKCTRSPTLTLSSMRLPSSILPGPTAMTSPSMGFSLAVSGMMIPPLVLSSSLTRLTITRS